MTRYLLPLSALCGVAIAWIDSRPTWDDTGITVGLMVLTSGLLGLAAPQRAWLWALGVGIWIPLHAIVTARRWDMLIVLAFPFVGAYAGFAVRKLGAAVTRAG